MAERDLDVVVFGATGVTGRRVAAYLAEHAGGARWAAAARDADKLERVLGEDGVSVPEALEADLARPDSLTAMAARARVVLNLVGPYTLHGEPVIEACVEGGAHYVDLAGEIPFVRRMIDAFHSRAEAAGVKVVQVCGFEALPPDLCVALAADAARRRFDEELAAADLEATIKAPPGLPRPSDAVSGGTIQSLVAMAAAEDAASITDPAALVTDSATAERIRARSPIAVAPRRGTRGAVVAPMAPAVFINPPVIQRSAAVRASERGVPLEPFRYREGIALPGGGATLPLRYGAAGVLSGVQAGLLRMATAPAQLRRRAARALGAVAPPSGFGPAADRLDAWRWRVSLTATTTSGRRVGVSVDAEGHPGYLATARMLGEAGLMLADEEATPDVTGCLTPATALGTEHVERFERARVRFKVGA